MESRVDGFSQNDDHSLILNGAKTDHSVSVLVDYFSDVFSFKDGFLFCEEKSVEDIRRWLDEHVIHSPTPFFVYSRKQIVSNVRAYLKAFAKNSRKHVLNYAVKANMNPTLAILMKNLGCSATLVSGFELRMVLELGFEPKNCILNGNGKQGWEIDLAVQAGCLLNIDSSFNLRQTVVSCRRLNKKARLLLRVNPDIDPEVHSYNATGVLNSKFGIAADNLDEILGQIKHEPCVYLVGLHCHLGSTITILDVFRRAAATMTKLFHEIKNSGFSNMEFINLGGGLGIPYTKHEMKTHPTGDCDNVTESVRGPSPAEVVSTINEAISDPGITLILEPGRSLIGDTAILVTSVLGVKHCQSKSYIVVDGAMTEVLRPALYGAYHHIDLAEPSMSPENEKKLYDIVGPVCESGDFLGKCRFLTTPHEGCHLAMFDVGAYCSCLSSNYNFRPRCAEVLVDKDSCTLIRKPDTYDSIMAQYLHDKEPTMHSAEN